MRFSLFCIGNREQQRDDDDDDVYVSVDDFDEDDGDDCVAKLRRNKDDDDNKSEATEVTSNTSTIDHHMDITNNSSHLVITTSVLDASNTTGPSIKEEESESARLTGELRAQEVLTIPEATDNDPETCCVRRQAGDAAESRVQFTSAPHRDNRGDPPAWPSRRRRGLPPRASKHRSRVTTCCASLPASKQPATNDAPPKRRGLPPRDRPSGNCALRICRVPSTSREAIENAKLVSQVRPPTQTHGAGIAALRMPVRQPTVCDDDDEQSRGMSLFSKPSVIRVETNPEEDFEHFHEVEDDDQLCLEGSQHLLLVHHNNSNNHNGNSSHLLHGSNSGSTTTGTTSASSTAATSVRVPLALTEERVRAHLRDYYEDFDSIFRLGKSSSAAWESFFSQYFTPDIQWVRSSSNSLTGPELAEHFAKDIKGIGMELVSIDSIQILAMGLSAVVTFTADQRFEYRGTPNSDRTVVTMVLTVDGSETNNGKEIRIAHEHRCTGKPIPK